MREKIVEKVIMMKRALSAVAVSLFGVPALGQTTVFQSDFDGSLPAEVTGVASLEPVQGYAGVGTPESQFGGSYLRNSASGNPAAPTVVTLTGLPEHQFLNITGLLAIIDSWDGTSTFGPDRFNVRVDGTLVFGSAFPLDDPPAGALLTAEPPVNLAVNGSFPDRAYDLARFSELQLIPHTADSVTIELFSDGSGWQAGNDESWAIDNLVVSVGSVSEGDVNLDVTQLIAPATAPAGGEIEVTWTVTNSGEGDLIGSWADRVLLSEDAAVGGDRLLGVAQGPSFLASGESYSRTETFSLPLGVQGQQFVIVQTDTGDTVAEANEADNDEIAAAPTNLVPAFPDLVVTSIEGPSTGGTWVPLSSPVIVTITNQGLAEVTGSWTDRFYLSNDDEVGGDIFWLDRTFSGTLEAGESYTVELPANSTSFRLPPNIGGDLRIRVETDLNDQVDEGPTGENNNNLVDPDVIVVAFPRLEVTSIVENGPWSRGNSAFVQWTVNNSGLGNARHSGALTYDEVYLSSDNIAGNEDDIFLAQRNVEFILDNFDGLPAGGSYTEDVTFDIPTDFTPGDYFLVIRLEDQDFVPEEPGNDSPFFISDAAVTVVADQPDLVITNIEGPATGATRTQLAEPLRVTVQNQGGAPAVGSWRTQVFLSADATFGSDSFIGQINYSGPALMPGDITVIEFAAASNSFLIPGDLAGVNTFTAAVDTTNIIDEGAAAGEDNNTAADDATIDVAYPRLEVTDIQSQSVWGRGNDSFVSWTVENTGVGNAYHSGALTYDQVFLSVDDVFGNADDIFIGRENTEFRLDDFFGVPSGDSYVESLNFTVPTDLPIGTYNVFIRVESEDFVPEEPGNDTPFFISDFTVEVSDAFPDLIVTDIQGPSIGGTRQRLTEPVTVTITNQGTIPATGSWQDRLFLSADQAFGGDSLIGTVTYNGPAIDPGASYTVTFAANSNSFFIPGDIAGQAFFTAQADWNNQLDEGDAGGEDNNGTADDASIEVAYPRLEVTDVQAPSTWARNNEITVEWTVTNTGEGSAYHSGAQTYDEVYLSADNIAGNEDDIFLTETGTEFILDNFFGVEPDNSYSRSVTFALPGDFTPGVYNLLIRVEDQDFVPEPPGNDDPFFFAPFAVEVSDMFPDLVVTDIRAPLTAGTRQQLSEPITITVTNQGTVPATGSWRVGVAVSGDDAVGGDVGFTTLTYNSGTVEPGASVDVQVAAGSNSFLFPANIAGPVRIVAQVDTNADVDEGLMGGEANNFAIDDDIIDVAYPRLELETLETPPLADAGAPVDIAWTVRNTGQGSAYHSGAQTFDEVYLSTDTIGGNSDDVFLGEVNIETRLDDFFGVQPNETYERALNPTLPADLPSGTYYFIVRVEDQDFVPEEPGTSPFFVSRPVFIGPYPDLTVTAVNVPAVVEIGSPVEISWTVTNEGTAPVSGTWIDEFLLSDDAAIGGDFALGSFNFSGTLGPGESYTQPQTVVVPPEAAGVAFFLVITDASDTIIEPFENNNFGTSEEQFEAVGPDLAIASVSAPASAEIGTPFMVSYAVDNLGTAPAEGPWVDALFISEDGQLSVDDQQIGSAPAPAMGPDLADGDSYAGTIEATLPLNGTVLPGGYSLLLVTDSGNAVFEISASNNISAPSAVTVTAPPTPDLVPSNVQFVTGSSLAGEPLTVTWTVTNSGDVEAAGPWTDRVWASTDAVLSVNDIPLGVPVDGPSSLGADGSYTRTLETTLPGPTGTYFVIVETDSGDMVVELDGEANNAASSASTFESIAEPNLTLESVGAPVSALPGSTITVTYRVRNTGTANASGPWTDRVVLSADDEIGNADDQVAGDLTFTGTIAPGSSRGFSRSVTLPATPGDFRVGVTADFFDSLAEIDETDNADGAIDRTAIGAADLVFASANAPTSATIGESFTYSWAVRNDGNAPASASWVDRVYLSTDDTLDIGTDTLLASISRSQNLPVGATYSQSRGSSWPNTPGQYWLFFVTDANERVPELAGESNNTALVGPIEVANPPLPDLEVVSVVAPAEAVAGQSITVSYTVENTGEEPAIGGWADAIYLSDNNTIGGSDTLLRLGPVSQSPLSPGERYTLSRTLTLPVGFDMTTAFLIVRTDESGDLEEIFDNNNTRASQAITIDPTPAPNLVAQSASAPSSGVFGETITVTWRTANTGEITADGPWSDAVFLSSDEALDPSDRLLGSLPFSGSIPMSEDSGLRTVDVELPLDTISAPGDFFIIVRADGFGGIDESDETDNDAPAVPITIELPPLPDIVVASVSAPAQAEPGDPFTVEYTLRNDGSEPATGEWLNEIRLAPADASGPGPVVAVTVFSGPLAPGETSAVQTATFALPDLGAQDRIATVVTDVDNSVLESDNDNNTGVAELPTSYIRPDLVIESILVESSLGSGPVSAAQADDQLTVTVTFRNDGDGTARGFWVDAVLLSTDNAVGADVLLATNGRTAPVGSGQTYTQTLTVTLPTDLDGDYWILAQTNRDQRIVESNTANNITVGPRLDVTQPPRPDLVVDAVSPPSNGLSGIMRELSWTVRNAGDAPADTLWSDRVILSTDPVLDAGDVVVANVPRPNTLDAGSSYTNFTTINLPSFPGQYYVFVRTDIGNTSNEGIFGGENNNASAPSSPFTVQTFTATAFTDVESEPAGTVISITGSATIEGTSDPAMFVPLDVFVSVRGFTQRVPATTDENGDYVATYTPGPTEGGRYSLGAGPRHLTAAPTTDSFSLWSITLTRQEAFVTATPNIVSRGSFQVRNQGDQPVTGLDAVVNGAPEGVDVQVDFGSATRGSFTIPGGSRIDVEYEILADRQVVDPFLVTLDFTADQPVEATFDLNLRVFPATPELVLLPEGLINGRVSESLLRGEREFVEFSVQNVGGVPTAPLSVNLPPVDWFSLATSSDLGSLGPNEIATVVVQLDPPADLDFGDITGTIGVTDGITGVDVPFMFDVVSEGMGDLSVLCTDEFFYYAEGSPPVTGATVRVFEVDTRDLVAQLISDESGIALFTDLTEAYYDIEVTSPDHGTFRTTTLVNAGEVNDLEAFLPRDVINYSWTVIPVDFEDTYNITIEAEFETNVPAPVVVIEPAFIDITDVELPIQVDLTITNYGLITADDYELSVGTTDAFEIITLVDFVGDIAGQQSVTVPIIIAAPGGARGGGGCGAAPVVGCHNLECGESTYTYCGGTLVSSGGGCGGGGTGGGFGGGGGGGGGFGGGGGGGGGGGDGTFSQGTSTTQPAACDPCVPKCALSALGCVPGAGCPAGVAGCAGMFDGSSTGSTIGSTANCIGAGVNCAVSLTPLASQLSCACAVLRDCVLCQSAGPGASGLIPCSPGDVIGSIGGLIGSAVGRARGGGVVIPSTGDPTADYFQEYYYAYISYYAFLAELFGGTEYVLDLGPDNIEDFQTLLATIEMITLVGSDAGESISASEQATLLASPRPGYLSEAQMLAFVERWNRSIDYYAADIRTEADLPEGFNPDFVDAGVMENLASFIRETEERAEQEEFDSIVDAIQYAELTLLLDVTDAGDGVCASVRIELDQTLTITRTAFEATFELENLAGEPLEAIGVDIRITDENGDMANDRFGIFDPELSGQLTQVDGTGSLPTDANGAAQWIILPTNEAAPVELTTYFVGGTLQYSNGGQLATVPLVPVEISVLPDPSLQLKYFLETVVYADDPFTPELEPSIPFDLGLLVRNNGAGVARDLTITSSQPRIVENERGLLIDFDIIGTIVGNETISPSLTVNLGDIGPDEANTARWRLISTLQGEFVSYSASYEHVSELNDPRLSLIDSVDIFGLNHIVLDVRPGEDTLPDFLTNDFPDPRDLPDTVHLSTGIVDEVESIIDPPFTADRDALEATITASPDDGGWHYIRIEDPFDSAFRLAEVVRADGQVIRMPENAWQTDRIDRLSPGSPVERFVHIFDRGSLGEYTLRFDPDNVAPEAVIVSSVKTYEGLSSGGSRGGEPEEIGVNLDFAGPTSEPRGPLERLVYTFSEAIDTPTLNAASLVVDGVDFNGDPVDLSGTVETIDFRAGGAVADITFDPPLPIGARYCVQLVGVTDRAGNLLAGPAQRLDVAVLQGDATGDLRINNTDVGAIGSLIGADPIDREDLFQVRADVNADGRVDLDDVNLALANRRTDVRSLTSPCLVLAQDDGSSGTLGNTLGTGATVSSGRPGASSKPSGNRDEPAALAERDETSDEHDADKASADLPATFDAGDGITTPLVIETGRMAFLDASAKPDATRLSAVLANFGFDDAGTQSWSNGWVIAELPLMLRDGAARAGLVRTLAERGVHASPVLRDEAGYVRLAGRALFVRFSDAVGTDWPQRVLATLAPAATIERGVLGDPSLVRITPAQPGGSRVIELVNALASRKDVAFAEPDWAFAVAGATGADAIASGLVAGDRVDLALVTASSRSSDELAAAVDASQAAGAIVGVETLTSASSVAEVLACLHRIDATGALVTLIDAPLHVRSAAVDARLAALADRGMVVIADASATALEHAASVTRIDARDRAGITAHDVAATVLAIALLDPVADRDALIRVLGTPAAQAWLDRSSDAASASGPTIQDAIALVARLGQATKPNDPADFDADGVITATDLRLLLDTLAGSREEASLTR